MLRRRREVRSEVETEPPRRPSPRAFDNEWAIAGLVVLLLVGGLLAWLFVFRDDSGENAGTTQTVTTQVETTVPADTAAPGTTAPAAATVPDLTGRPYAEATDAAAAAGLAADSYPVDSEEARGTVGEQEPDAGTSAQEGERMRLNVAVGPGERPATEVPDVTGPEEAEAGAKVVAAGLTVRTVDRAAPEPDNVGEVILQEPDAGTSVPELSQITMYVGR